MMGCTVTGKRSWSLKTAGRKCYILLPIPAQIRRNKEIVDGGSIKLSLTVGNDTIKGNFHITSGGEFYLPAMIQKEIKVLVKKNKKADLIVKM